jgi:phosphatidylglycerophosphatase A
MIRQRIAILIATAGGAGYSPIGPGTCGTLVTVPIAWWCRSMGMLPYLGLVTLVALIGIWAAGEADRAWGKHDSQRIVIDEVAGYLLTMALVDRGSGWALAAGFLVFRLLDIAKPGPIRWLDRHVKGGLGVMLDDLVAGAVGAFVLLGLSFL